MSIQSDSEIAGNVAVGGTDRSALFYDSVEHIWKAKDQAGTITPLALDGKTILNGIIAPTTEGVDGDFYINTATSDIYGPKSSGMWGSPTSLIGPTGATGPTGPTGPQGPSHVKAKTIAGGSFSGTPKKFSVVFVTPYSDATYAITITGTDSRNYTYESKSAAGFTINANANTALSGEVSWLTTIEGENI